MSPALSWLLCRLLTVVLCYLIALPSDEILVSAQTPQFGLRVLVVEGDGARHVIGQAPSLAPTVLVEDSANRPVQNALVVFSLPEAGAGGVFADGSRTATAVTGPDGRAALRGFRPNARPGSYNIRVRVTFLNETVTESIFQTNVVPEKKGSGRLVAILAIAGGAAAGVALATGDRATSGNNSTPPTPARPTIAFGSASVGPPR